MEYILNPKKIPVSVLFNDLSSGEFILISAFLKYEEKNQGKHITVNELASELDVSIPAVSRMLKNLESRNIVVRETDKDCRRNTLVIITQNGMELYEENKEKMRYLASKMLEQFTEQEVDHILNLSKKIEQTLEQEIEFIQNNI